MSLFSHPREIKEVSKLDLIFTVICTVIAKHIQHVLDHCLSEKSLLYYQINQETSKPKLAPLIEGGVSELLNKVKKHIAWILCTDLFQQIGAYCELHKPMQIYSMLNISLGDSETTGGKQ